MKFLHTSDLHIGKSIYEFSMLEEQKYILKQMIDIAKAEEVDAFLIAGDIYDRSIPSAEAVLILNDFLTELMENKISIFMIAGNHDSPERLHFANKILEKQGLTIAGLVEEEAVKNVILEDNYGKIEITMLPFIKPAAYGGKNSQEAVEKLLGSCKQEVCCDSRRICMTHFFVTQHGKAPELSDAETSVYVGGLDNVESRVFTGFDYVALGHIHKAQKIGDQNIYYSGSPMKYSFSEASYAKSINIVTMKEKGVVLVERKELKPLRELIQIKGKLEQLVQYQLSTGEYCEDYVQVTLLDEEELVDPIGTLRSVYPNICQLILNRLGFNATKIMQDNEITLQKQKTLPELFREFYHTVIGQEMDEERDKIIREIMKEVQE